MAGVWFTCTVSRTVYWHASVPASSIQDPHWRYDGVTHILFAAILSDDGTFDTRGYKLVIEKL